MEPRGLRSSQEAVGLAIHIASEGYFTLLCKNSLFSSIGAPKQAIESCSSVNLQSFEPLLSTITSSVVI
ncbi:hypothetical protein PCANC_02546 [Puccinia coronata f. sp. avenae]|uniref:Uncharacterized protein n=1 Tax=Puccinia coronata f. sp. avenae TaxID=200324 RepID=A0A2N5VYG6_9BASI|nr:hypothetical protein PCANC_02546 [Puccinia coronata f. sp. avenae]